MILQFIFIIGIGCAYAQISSVGEIHPQPSRIEVSDSIQSCCSPLRDTDFNQLMRCTNISTTSYLDSVYASIPYNANKEGPRFVVALLTRATPDIFDYASYSYFLQAAYANHNGYALLPLLPDSDRPDYIRFRKLVPLSDALRGIAADCDYLVWLDAGNIKFVLFAFRHSIAHALLDIVILDFAMRIEKVAAEYPKAHMIVSADVSSPVNSGFIIFRNTPWSLRFIEEWLAVREKAPKAFTDQMGFDYMYRKLTAEEKSKFAILRPDALNSDAPPMGRQLPHNQVLHLAAESSAMRANVFRRGAREVCAAMEESRAPLHQLGLSREVIRDIAEKRSCHFVTCPLTNQLTLHFRFAYRSVFPVCPYLTGSSHIMCIMMQLWICCQQPARQVHSLQLLSPPGRSRHHHRHRHRPQVKISSAFYDTLVNT
jgi:hypothetical protein